MREKLTGWLMLLLLAEGVIFLLILIVLSLIRLGS